MHSFTVNIQYTPEELQSAYKLHNQKIFPVGSRLLLILGLICIGFGLLLFLYSFISFAFINGFAVFLIAYGILMVVLHIWRHKTMGKRMFRKMP